MQACGVGWSDLLRPTALVGLLGVALIAALTVFASPWSARYEQTLKQQMREQSALALLTPGRFIESSDGGIVLFVREGNTERTQFEDVFMYRAREGEPPAVDSARIATYQRDEASGNEYLVFDDGQTSIGRPGEADFTVTDFRRQGRAAPAERRATRRACGSRARRSHSCGARVTRPIRPSCSGACRFRSRRCCSRAARRAAQPHLSARGPLRQDRARDPDLHPVRQPAGTRAQVDRRRHHASLDRPVARAQCSSRCSRRGCSYGASGGAGCARSGSGRRARRGPDARTNARHRRSHRRSHRRCRPGGPTDVRHARSLHRPLDPRHDAARADDAGRAGERVRLRRRARRCRRGAFTRSSLAPRSTCC